MTNKFFTLYDRPVARSVVCGPSMALQSFAAEADINTIMAKYNRTGFLVDPTIAPSRSPQFGDFETFDYQAALNQIIEADAAFDALPSALRKRFNNNPAELLLFLEDPGNKDAAIALGLIDALPPAQAPADVVSPPAQLPT